VSRRPSAILVEKRTESSAGVGLQLRLPQHADQHGPKRPILLAVDQAFREDARLRWSKRGDGRVRPDGEGGHQPCDSYPPCGEFRPPEPDPPERVVFDLRLPGPDDPHTD